MQLSVRWQLLLAFLGISAFAVLAALAATWAFLQVGAVMARVTEERAPAALASLELSRQADRIVAAAPALLSATTFSQAGGLASGMRAQHYGLLGLLGALKGSSADKETLKAIDTAVAGLRRNLDALHLLGDSRVDISRRKGQLLRRLADIVASAQRIVAPAILVLDSKLAARDNSGGPKVPDRSPPLLDEVLGYIPLQKTQLEIAAVNDTLIKAADAPTLADLPLLMFPLHRSLETLRSLGPELDSSLRGRFLDRVGELAALIDGPDSILAARESELEILRRGEQLLSENVGLSASLTAAVDRLVSLAKADIANSGIEARQVQWVSTILMAAVVGLSILSSALIVWLYVDRNLVGRLKALADSMLAIAGGELHAPLPRAGGDEIGHMAEALTVFRDTAVEVEEQRLRERQVVLDTIDYGVLLLDPALRVRVFNRAYVHLSDLDEAFLRQRPGFAEVIEAVRSTGTFYDVKDEDWPGYAAARLAELRDGVVPPREWRLNDGRIIEYQGVTLPDGGRMLTYFELTRLKHAEEELRASKEQAELASRAKSDFLASMSHELRTPLNAIIGITEMLKEEVAEGGSSELDEPLSRILRASRLLLQLINEILDLAKIEAGKLELHPEQVDLDSLLRDVLQTAEPLAEKNRNRLVLDCPVPIGWVIADPMRLRQIVLNLLSNACKFTEAGSITLAARRERTGDGEWLRLAIADTGIGIKPEQLGQLFQEFSQAGTSRKSCYGGTGLGLAISRRLARLMGGEIWVESKAEHGSVFTVSLPANLHPGSRDETIDSGPSQTGAPAPASA